MHRFYISPENWNADKLVLEADEAHHALDVLRMRQGDRAVVFNGRGAEATVEFSSVGKKRVELRRIHHAQTPKLRAQITLAQAIPKGKNMDLIVQKATELGAAAIAPLLSERTVVQIDETDARDKQAKWQAVAIEAAKQCGQNWLPIVQPPQSTKSFFEAKHRFDLALIGSLQPDAIHLKKVLADFEAQNKTRPANVLVCIGPEGDFTPAEVALAKSRGCRPITLGPIILRTETAAIYCLSVLSHELFA